MFVDLPGGIMLSTLLVDPALEPKPSLCFLRGSAQERHPVGPARAGKPSQPISVAVAAQSFLTAAFVVSLHRQSPSPFQDRRH